MQSRSAEGRVVATLGRVLPAGSEPASILRDLLDDAPPTEQGEQQFVADSHSSILAVAGSVLLLPAIGIMALIDSMWGLEVARRVGGLLFAPSAFLLTLGLLVQLAKFRGRFDGVQPRLGRGSWAACIVVVLTVAIIFGIG